MASICAGSNWILKPGMRGVPLPMTLAHDVRLAAERARLDSAGRVGAARDLLRKMADHAGLIEQPLAELHLIAVNAGLRRRGGGRAEDQGNRDQRMTHHVIFLPYGGDLAAAFHSPSAASALLRRLLFQRLYLRGFIRLLPFPSARNRGVH